MSRFNGFSTMVSKFRTGFWMLLLISCTIIEDSDIKSPSDFSKLKLKGLEIKQTTNKGDQTNTAQITLSSSGKIEKINWPALGNYKLKFRSPISTSSTSLLLYNSAGNLTTFDTQVGSQSVEKYDFLYNLTGQLIRLISSGTLSNNVVSTSDSLIYNTQERLIKLERTIKYTTGADTKINISDITYQNDFGALAAFTYGKTFKLSLGTGYCSGNANSSECTRFEYQTNTQGGVPNVLIKHSLTGSIINQIEFSDIRTGGGGGGNDCFDCSRSLDSYYFHPLMLASPQIKQGSDLLSVYMIDWWIQGTGQPTTNITKNEYLYFNFTYFTYGL